MNTIREVALRKEGHTYLFRADGESYRALLSVLRRFATNANLNFSWHDAAVVCQKIRQPSAVFRDRSAANVNDHLKSQPPMNSEPLGAVVSRRQIKRRIAMPENYDANDLFQQVKHALDEMGWSFGESAEGLCLRTGSSEANGFHTCFLRVDKEFPIISIQSRFQCRVPEEKRAVMLEFANRANCNVWLGHFEVDLSDGEVRFRTVVNLADGVLTTGMLGAMLYANVYTVDRYLTGAMGILWNDLDPEDAIGFCGDAEEEAA